MTLYYVSAWGPSSNTKLKWHLQGLSQVIPGWTATGFRPSLCSFVVDSVTFIRIKGPLPAPGFEHLIPRGWCGLGLDGGSGVVGDEPLMVLDEPWVQLVCLLRWSVTFHSHQHCCSCFHSFPALRSWYLLKLNQKNPLIPKVVSIRYFCHGDDTDGKIFGD